MNVEHINELIETIRDHQEAFDMSSYTHDCGTPSCIAGWGAWLHRGRPLFSTEWSNYLSESELAEKYLGLTKDQARVVFLDKVPAMDIGSVTPEEAIAVLNNLIETGKVDWSIAGYRYTEIAGVFTDFEGNEYPTYRGSFEQINPSAEAP